SQLTSGNESIISTHTIIPNIGTKGTKGVLNGRFAVGLLLRKTSIPIHTNVNANNVPILTICPRSDTGTNPANMLTKTIKIKFVFHGVCLLDKSENILGKRPSLLIE